MDLFVLLDPSAAIVSDDEKSSDAGMDIRSGAACNDGDVAPKRHMPSSPPRPSLLLRKKSRRGSPNRGVNFLHTHSPKSLSRSPPSTPTTSQRILMARAKRHTLQKERIETVARQNEIRTTAALIRAESHLQSKVLKANRCDERLSIAQEKKLFMETERRVTIQTTTEQRTERALKRAESVLEQKRAKARPSIDRVTAVRERKSSFELHRAQSLQDNLDFKVKSAAIRAKQSIQSRQNRARQQDRVARVKARRSLQEFERRTALLSSLDHKVKRASRKLEEVLQDRRDKAAEEIRRARLVSRKVKAARSIQRLVRWKILGQGRPSTAMHTFPSATTCTTSTTSQRQQRVISHNEAAVLLQSWRTWKDRVSASRFAQTDEEYIAPRDALKILVSIVEDKDGQPPSFDAMRSKMVHPGTIEAARVLVEALRQPARLNDRTLLSAFLISAYPAEVLDADEKDKRAKMLAKASCGLVSAIQALAGTLSEGSISSDFVREVCSRAIAFNELFHLWKDADLSKLIGNMTKSAEQSWIAYLSSCEALSYMLEVQGGSLDPDDKHDPLMSLRMRHEASKAGARTHIKRLRVSLNKLVGSEEGRQLVKDAKERALRQIVEDNIVAALKEEVNQQYQGSSFQPDDGESALGGKKDTATNAHCCDPTGTVEKTTGLGDESALGDRVPSEILANEELVHRILLTDPSDFHKLSWNDQTSEGSVSVDDFMARWVDGSRLHSTAGVSPEKMITENMKQAFFDLITEDLGKGDYTSMRNVLLDLHESLRKLVPSRTDLHSYLRDEEVKAACSVNDISALLLTAADALANNLEAPARASSTLDWIRVASEADAEAHYGLSSRERYVVASCAFLLFKTEMCHIDIANFRLMEVAPLIHKLGPDYKLGRLNARFALGESPSIDELKHKLPSTNAWIMSMLASPESQAEIVRANSTGKRFACLKSRGFVDSLLFSTNQLAMPEIFGIDTARIMHIRNESRLVVIASALGLHISNMSRADPSILATVPLSSQLLEEKRQELYSALRAPHTDQKQFFAAVADVVISFALTLGMPSITPTAEKSLKNTVAAVLRGFDPVVKLLDNRVKQFMRNVCRWQPSTSAPIPMQTGRSMLKGEDAPSARSTKELFVVDALKEAKKSGFSLFADNLIDVGDMAYHVVDVAIKSYGDSVLDRLLVDAALTVSE